MGKPIGVHDLKIPDLHKFGHVDDYRLSYEWSKGGVIHAHIAPWIVGSPRIDLNNVPREVSKGVIEVEIDSEDVRVVEHKQDATHMASFWDRTITEFNVANADKGHKDGAAKASSTSCCASADAPEVPVDYAADKDANAKQATDNGGSCTGPSNSDAIDVLYSLCNQIGRRKDMGVKAERATTSPECISVDALTHCLLETGAGAEEESRRCCEECHDIMSNCSRSFDSTRKSNGLPLTAVGDAPSHGLSLTAVDNNSRSTGPPGPGRSLWRPWPSG